MLASEYMEANKREYGRSRPGIWTLASEDMNAHGRKYECLRTEISSCVVPSKST